MTTQQTPAPRRSGPRIIAILVILLLVLHQDNWFWTDDTLVLGFLPIGLFWHACISVGAALTWLLATRIAWPFDDQPSNGRQPASEGQQPAGNGQQPEGGQ